MASPSELKRGVVSDVSATADDRVVPRWEWRAFERSFVLPPSAAEVERFDAPVERDETYLLSLLSPHSVKIRDGRLDIKRLERSEAHGLELWRPVLRAAFPVEAGALAAGCDAWGVPGPAGDTPAHSLADLVRNVVVPHRQLRIVTLTKRRLPITVAGCRGERAQITVGGHHWNTVVFEDADPGRVLAALAELKLDPAANENFPRALKRILGLPDHASSPAAPRAG
ncbi:MAG TPA: hypothetical protein VMV51_00865 [Gemmatimonadaceae bacterium]|nr:hypothetical protein [Gemmatimonadaceae bacterium]